MENSIHPIKQCSILEKRYKTLFYFAIIGGQSERAQVRRCVRRSPEGGRDSGHRGGSFLKHKACVKKGGGKVAGGGKKEVAATTGRHSDKNSSRRVREAIFNCNRRNAKLFHFRIV